VIDLTALEIQTASLSLIDNGGELTPPLGGVTQRIDRLGSRHAIAASAPPKVIEPDGRLWISRLKRAKREGGRIAFPQPDLVIGNPGSPQVAGNVAAGSTIPLRNLTPGYQIREGQWLSVTHNGRSYLYSVDGAVTANGSGNATVAITPLLRSQLTAGDAVNLAAPVLEGWLSGEEFAWTLDAAHTVGLQFTVTERA
jgi:hypothetical protein